MYRNEVDVILERLAVSMKSCFHISFVIECFSTYSQKIGKVKLSHLICNYTNGEILKTSNGFKFGCGVLILFIKLFSFLGNFSETLMMTVMVA